MDPTELRRHYGAAALRRRDLADDPIAQFRLWFEQAIAAELLEANAMVLSTVAADQPSSRTVLLKAYDQRGFVFFTNSSSRKARQIAANGRVGLLFPWYGLERQVEIQGEASPIALLETLTYFRSRPRGSQLGAWVSQQSSVISGRQLLEQQLAAMRQRFEAGELPLPPFWSGYRVRPQTIEFWQGGADRLHDRLAQFVRSVHHHVVEHHDVAHLATVATKVAGQAGALVNDEVGKTLGIAQAARRFDAAGMTVPCPHCGVRMHRCHRSCGRPRADAQMRVAKWAGEIGRSLACQQAHRREPCWRQFTPKLDAGAVGGVLCRPGSPRWFVRCRHELSVSGHRRSIVARLARPGHSA